MATQVVTSKILILPDLYMLHVYPNMWRRLLHWPIGSAMIDPRHGELWFRGAEYGCGGMTFEQIQRRAVEMIEQKAGR